MSGHVWRMGSTGDTPVPVGDSPNGRPRGSLAIDHSLLAHGALPVPPGESPGGTGHWPTAIELSLGKASVGRPLPARNERGEGWGEGKSNKNATPLPGPLLLLRRKRGRRARSIPLIQCQCSLTLPAPQGAGIRLAVQAILRSHVCLLRPPLVGHDNGRSVLGWKGKSVIKVAPARFRSLYHSKPANAFHPAGKRSRISPSLKRCSSRIMPKRSKATRQSFSL